MKAGRYVLYGLLVFWGGSNAQATDYANLYSRSTLQRASDTYAENLRGVWREDLLSRLTFEERRSAMNIQLDLPLVGQNAHPFDYYAQPHARRVTIPILSVKFLDDLAIAQAWLDRNGCNQLAVSDYVGLIRYQSAESQPGNRFPPPLSALGVPSNALDDVYVNDVSGKTLKSAIYFLMAHELAHVIYGHRSYDTLTAGEAQRQEREADAFALGVMRRIAVAPAGMALFFTIASRFELAPGDFDSMRDYEQYLRTSATHPLTSARLVAIADGIRSNAASFSRGQADPAAWQPRIRKIADNIEEIGRTLDDRQIRELQRYRSRSQTLTDLARNCG